MMRSDRLTRILQEASGDVAEPPTLGYGLPELWWHLPLPAWAAPNVACVRQPRHSGKQFRGVT